MRLLTLSASAAECLTRGQKLGFAVPPKFTYEVKVLREKRWTVDRIFMAESEALQHAEKLVKTNAADAVRVEKERERHDGTYSSTIIFDRTCDGKRNVQVAIIAIDSAPPCAGLDDLYGLDARLTMWRILRKYFDHVTLCPSEILYNYGALAKLMDNDPPVYPAAIDKIAALQAPALNVDSRARRDELYKWMDDIARRARSAEKEKRLFKESLKDYGALAEMATLISGGGEERDTLIRCAIARELYTNRNWLSKLEKLLQAVAPGMSHEDLAIIDGFVADILGSAQVIQEIIGSRSTLFNALMGLIDLMDGREEDYPPKDTPEVTQVLRRMIADGSLPSGANVLLDRIKAQISSKQPLNRINPDQEQESFVKLMTRLSGVRGFRGGPEMAEVLTSRCGMQFQEGGVTGRKLAVGAMINMIRDPLQKIRYMISISETETGVLCADVVHKAIHQLKDAMSDINKLVPGNLSATRRLMAVTEIQKALMESVLTEDIRTQLVSMLDDVLVNFIEREGFIDRLDDPELGLRERSVRLIKFCSSGLLLEGRALELARKRIAAHLRQPNFVQHYVEGCQSQAEADEALRDLHKQLAMAGFRG